MNCKTTLVNDFNTYSCIIFHFKIKSCIKKYVVHVCAFLDHIQYCNLLKVGLDLQDIFKWISSCQASASMNSSLKSDTDNERHSCPQKKNYSPPPQKKNKQGLHILDNW